MQNGLYKVQFQTQLGMGYGVVTIDGETVQGGDARLFYVGSFRQNDNDVHASVRTNAHTNTPGVRSVFGIDKVHIDLVGRANGDIADLVGTAAEAPGIQFKARLTRIAA